MPSDTTQALLDVLLLLVTVGAGMLTKYLKGRLQQSGAPQRLSNLLDMARTAVVAAEKFIGPSKGAEKLFYATAALRACAKQVGIKVTDEEASALIHAALAELDGILSSEPDVPVKEDPLASVA